MESPIFISSGINFSSEIMPDEKIKVIIEINSDHISHMLYNLEDSVKEIEYFSYERIKHSFAHSHIIIIGTSIIKMIYLIDVFTVSTLRIEYGRYRPMTIKAIDILNLSKELYKSDIDPPSSFLEERGKMISELLTYEEEEASKSLLQRHHERYEEILQREKDDKEMRKQRLIEKKAKQLEERVARRMINSNVSEADRIAGRQMRKI